MIFPLVQDFADVLDAMPAGHPRRRILTLLDEAIRRDVHFIDRHPTTLFQCLWNMCWWFDCLEAEEHFHPRDVQSVSLWRRLVQAIGQRFRKPSRPENPVVEDLLSTWLVRWRRQKQATTPDFFWVRSLRPPLIALGIGIHQRCLGHQSVIHEVAFSPDGRCLASCSYDETIRLWNVATGAELRTLTSLKGMLYAVRFSPDGRWLAAGSLNHEIFIWDALTGEEYRRWRCQGSINGIAFSPDSRSLAIACDAAIELWDVTRRYLMKTFTGHQGKVSKVAFAPDGKVLASASHDGVVLTWDLQTGYVLRIFIGRKRWLVKLAVGADGRRQVLRRWVDHPGWIIDLAFAPDGQTLASASHDGFVRIWNVKRGREIRLLVGHTQGVNAVAYTPDGRYIVSAGADATVRVWNAANGSEIDCMQGHTGIIMSVAISPNGEKLATAGWDETIYTWRFTNHREVRFLKGLQARGNAYFSPDNQLVATNSVVSKLLIWNATTGHVVAEISTTDRWTDIYTICFAPDQSHIAFGGSHNKLCIMNIQTLSGFNLETEATVHSIAYAPHGRTVVAGLQMGNIVVWDLATKTQIAHFGAHDYEVKCVAFSPDGRFFASGGIDRKIKIWDAVTFTLQHTLPCESPKVTRLCFTADGNSLVSQSDNENVTIWDCHTGNRLEVVPFSVDVKAIASGAAAAPYWALARPLETEICSVTTRQTVTWYPMEFGAPINGSSDGRIWVGFTAGDLRGHVHFFTLEGS
jgi:WD40 repeat protein